jgi:hypothetical protein
MVSGFGYWLIGKGGRHKNQISKTCETYALPLVHHAAMLHTRNNPGFFKGTVVEQAVADELGLEERASPAATA